MIAEHNGITIKYQANGSVWWMSHWERLPELLKAHVVRIVSPDGYTTDIYMNL